MTDDARPPTRARLDLDWTRTAGGALAAVSSAVLLSRIGAAGTIIGAALGSVVVTVAGAFYSQGLERSRQRLGQAHTLAAARVGSAQAEVRRASRRQTGPGSSSADPAARSDLQHAEENLADAQRDLDRVSDEAADPRAGLSWRDRLAVLPWRRIAWGAVAVFALAVVLITAFELVTGRSVAAYTGGTHSSGGTSLTRLTDSGGGSGGTPAPQPSESGSPSSEPTPGEATPTEPTPTQAAPSAPATPSASLPTASSTPSSTPESTPSEAPVGPVGDVPTP